MKTIVAGSRHFTDYEVVKNAIETCGWKPSAILSGMASGVDTLGVQYATENNIQLLKYPANWYKHGKAAGPVRNRAMARAAEALIAIWDGESRETKNMIEEAEKLDLKVHIVRI